MLTILATGLKWEFMSVKKTTKIKKNSTYVFPNVLGPDGLVGSVGRVQGAEDQPAKSKERVGHGEDGGGVQSYRHDKVLGPGEPGRVKLDFAPVQNSRRQAGSNAGYAVEPEQEVDQTLPLSNDEILLLKMQRFFN